MEQFHSNQLQMENICAVVDEQNQLLPRSSSASDWEKFEIVEIQNGEYALKARANNKYVKSRFR